MIPARYANILFGFILSGLMSAIVVAIATFRTVESWDLFLNQWFWSWLPAWGVAFPTVLVIGPLTRRIVASMTRPE